MGILPEKKAVKEIGDGRSENKNGTDWDRLLMAGFLSFLSSLQLSPLLVILWPYIKQIDLATNVAFYGIVIALFQTSYAGFSVIFSIWTYKSQKFRWPLLAGRSVALLTCILYLAVEYAESGRRIYILVFYSMLGIAEGSSSVLSIYAHCFATEKDSQKAKNVVMIGYIVGFLCGPVITVAFSPLEYPSSPLVFSKVLVNAYTCPIWISLSINAFSLIVLSVCFAEFEVGKAAKELVDKYSIRDSFSSLRSLHFTSRDRYFILCHALIRMVAELNTATFMTLTAPTFMIIFGMSGELTVLFFSICIIISMALSLVVRAVLDTDCWRNRSIEVHILLLTVSTMVLCLLIAAISFIVIICLPGSRFCEENTIPFIGSYMLAFILSMGVALPLLKHEAHTLYSSQVNINQPVLNGCVTLLGEMALVLAPLYTSFTFSVGHLLSYSLAWTINSLFIVFLIFALLVASCISPLTLVAGATAAAKRK